MKTPLLRKPKRTPTGRRVVRIRAALDQRLAESQERREAVSQARKALDLRVKFKGIFPTAGDEAETAFVKQASNGGTKEPVEFMQKLNSRKK